MADAQYDFGVASRLDADALGEPGQRTFRLLVQSGDSSALLWIEKEQLLALAAAIEQVIEQAAPDEAARGEIAPVGGPIQDFPLNPTVEFRVGTLQLGHDPANEQFLLLAGDAEQAEEAEQDQDKAPTLTVRMDYRAAIRLSKQVAALDAAGRPRCPLCGQPMGPGLHHCPLSNGQVH
jgi:uncharacterized repeat protein (TIGR03847 family)